MDVIVKGSPSIEIGFERKVVDSYKAVDSALSETSKNPVENAVITKALQASKKETASALQSLEKSKANTTGYYPQMSVGFADDLVGRGESVPAEFSFRASGGKSIKDGTAWIKRLKGNSVVWNQLRGAAITSHSYNKAGISCASTLGSNLIKMSGTLEEYSGDKNFYNVSNFPNIKSVIGHKYLCSIVGNKNITMTIYGHGPSVFNVKSNAIVTCIEGESINIVPQIGSDVAVETVIDETIMFLCHDLTQMFGAGNEPTTIEEFYARKPIVEDEFAYNEGEVIHMTAEGIKSVGDNAWDEEWEVNGSYISSKNYIRVIPNAIYYTNVALANGIRYYDKDYNRVGSTAYAGAGQTFIVPANVQYMTFGVAASYGTTYNNDIMLTLVHSGWKQDTDAGYQPYWQDTLPLPIIRKYFPDGMKKAGSAHDEIRFNKASGKWEAVQRIGSVDMSQFRWYQGAGFWASYNSYEFMSDMKKPTGNGEVANICCKKYVAGSWTSVYEGTEGNIAMYSVDGRIGIVDSSIQTEADVRAAMAGVLLYYELAEPTIIEYDEPFNLDYKVADFGTEQAIAEQPSAPISADIIYQFNAVDMIREHEIKIAELQSIIATMQAQLASLTSNNE